VALPNGAKALNLGCGVHVADGWINIDNSPNARLAKLPWLRWLLWKVRVISDEHYRVVWPGSMTIRDLSKPLPFADCSIDFVYSSHFLEHNSRGEGEQLVAEIHRVLKPGGLVRIVVPDLEFGARRYLDALSARSNASQAAADFLDWLQLGRRDLRDPHLWMYDAASLKAMLIRAGFAGALVRPYREGGLPDCEILDNRPKDSVHIEARKAPDWPAELSRLDGREVLTESCPSGVEKLSDEHWRIRDTGQSANL
jgi:SAM-dependent methyltransferase